VGQASSLSAAVRLFACIDRLEACPTSLEKTVEKVGGCAVQVLATENTRAHKKFHSTIGREALLLQSNEAKRNGNCSGKHWKVMKPKALIPSAGGVAGGRGGWSFQNLGTSPQLLSLWSKAYSPKPFSTSHISHPTIHNLASFSFFSLFLKSIMMTPYFRPRIGRGA